MWPFAPRCPVDPAAKAWIEDGLTWLSHEFDRTTFTRRAVLRPREDFFPDGLTGDADGAQTLLTQTAAYMDADAFGLRLHIIEEEPDVEVVDRVSRPVQLDRPETDGWDPADDPDAILFTRPELADVPAVIATLARELAYRLLVEAGLRNGDEADCDLLADLVAAFHGFGVFVGNHALYEEPNGYWPGTSLVRPRAMTLPMHAHTLAHAAWHRGDRRPEWLGELTGDLRANAKPAIAYLFATGDSAFGIA